MNGRRYLSGGMSRERMTAACCLGSMVRMMMMRTDKLGYMMSFGEGGRCWKGMEGGEGRGRGGGGGRGRWL